MINKIILYFIALSPIYFTVNAIGLDKFPIVAEADGYFYWQAESYNEYSTGFYCEKGDYLKNNKKFCKISQREDGERRICKIKKGKDVDNIMFCVNGNWAELYTKNEDSECLTYLYDNILDIKPKYSSTNVKKGDIIGWASSEEKAKPIIIFNGCYK